MVPEGLEAWLDLGCGYGSLCQTAINKLHGPHHPRTTSFVPPSSTGASSHSILRLIDPTRPCNPRLVGFGVLGPDIALPSVFDWLFLGPELSWSVACFVLIIFIIAPVTQGWLQRSRARCLVLRLCCLVHPSCGQRRPPLGRRESLATFHIWVTTSNPLTVTNDPQ